MRHATPLLSAVWLTLAAGCGARSSLFVGSAGGTPVAECPQVQPIIDVADPGDARMPSIASINATPLACALVYTSRPPAQATVPAVRTAGFEGFAAWPPAPIAAVDMVVTQFQGEDSAMPLRSDVVLASSMQWPAYAGQFQMMWHDANLGIPRSMLAETNGEAEVTSFEPGSRPLALMVDPANHAMGFGQEVPDAPGSQILARLSSVLDPGGLYLLLPGCATTPMSMDGVVVQDGWLLGTALGTPAGWDHLAGLSCGERFPTVGPATQVTFTFFPPPAIDESKALTSPALGDGTPVTRLRLAPSGDGAWAVFSTVGSPDLWMSRVVEQPSGPTPSPQMAIGGALGDLVTTSFDVARFGQHLLLAAAEVAPDGHRAIVARLLDDGGSALWKATIPIDGEVDPPLRILASGEGDKVLIAWSERAAGASAHRVRITRIDCPAPP